MNRNAARARLSIALVAFAAVVIAAYVYAGIGLVRYDGLRKDPGWYFTTGAGGWTVLAVDAKGPAAGKLEPGDRIVSIDGDREAGDGLLWAVMRRIPPGMPYVVRVAGPRGERDEVLTARLTPAPGRSARNVGFFLCGLSFLTVAVTVLALRPHASIARLLVLALLLGAFAILRPIVVALEHQMNGAVLWFATLFAPLLLMPVGFAFYHRFPDGEPKSRLTVLAERILAAVGVLLFVVLAALLSFPARPWVYKLYVPFENVRQAFLSGAVLADCAILARTYFTERDAQTRRRVKWAVYGSFLGLVPLAIITMSLVFERAAVVSAWRWTAAMLFVALVPVSFGYAVVKERLFDIDVVVRRGVQYLLARNALRAFVLVPLAGIAYALYRNRQLPLSRIVVENTGFLFVLALAAVALRFRGEIADTIDRRFFRQAYDRERVLGGLADRIQRLDTETPGTLPEVAGLVLSEVDAVLHPAHASLLFRPGESRFDGCTLRDSRESAELRERGFESVAALRARELPRRSFAADELAGADGAWLRENAVDLVVPVTSSARRLHGFLLLGARLSETPYAATDRRLLEAITDQVAAAYQTFLLREQKERLAEKVIELEVSERRALVANRAKSAFLATMSHELRTPLNAVIGFAELIARSRTIDDEDRQSLRIIRTSGEHLLGLINDVLSIAKIEAGKVELVAQPFDLAALLESVRDLVRNRAEAKRLTMRLEVDASLPRVVVGDEGRLRQVLLNLLGNAVKFTASGGVTLRARWDAGRARIEVEDTGRGISDQELGTLFEPFVQTESGRASKEGTGLGLYISRQVARLMGGDIEVSSRPGAGSTFSVDAVLDAAEDVLPVTAPAEDPLRVVGLELSPADRRPRLLVVDDVEENRLLLAKLLVSVGFDVREARNGVEAIEEWRTWQPDLVFMDMRMPVMDGREATRAIRGLPNGARAKVVALTASAMEHEREEILSCGADDFVTKPYREGTIFETLERQLGCRFRREERATEAEETGAARAAVLTKRRIAALPPAALEGLYEALLRGDFDRGAALAERLRTHDDALGRAVLAEIRAYRADGLLALLDPSARGGAA